MKYFIVGLLGFLLLVFMGLCIFLLNQNEDIKSDLCYSLKTNRVVMDGFVDVINKFGEGEEEFNAGLFYYELEQMEERNWMECEE